MGQETSAPRAGTEAGAGAEESLQARSTDQQLGTQDALPKKSLKSLKQLLLPQPPKEDAHTPHTSNPKENEAQNESEATSVPFTSEPPSCGVSTSDQSTEQPLNTVEVRGLNPTTELETVQLYFEFKKRSGGGPVKDVTVDKFTKIVYVTFENVEDAMNVIDPSRVHTIEGSKVEVVQHKPPEALKNFIILRDLPDSLDRKDLVDFLQTLVRQSLHSLFFDHEKSALVQFDVDIDVVEVKRQLTSSKISGQTIRAQNAVSSGAILVKDLPSSVTEDALLFYFENTKRSGGSDVSEVRIMPEERCALVLFQDPTVAPLVAMRSHRINDQDLNVRLFFEFLGTIGGLEERPLKIPAPLTITLTPNESQKLQLLNQIPFLMERLTAKLKASRVYIDSFTDNILLQCDITESTPNVPGLLKTWAKDAKSAFLDFLADIQTQAEKMNPEDFSKAETQLRQQADRIKVGLVYQQQYGDIFIVFDKENDTDAKKLQSAIRTKRDQLCREKRKTHNTIGITCQEMQLLTEDIMTIRKKHPRLEIGFENSSECLHLTGVKEEIEDVKNTILRQKDEIARQSLTFDEDFQIHIPSLSKAKETLEEACLKEDPKGAFRLTPSGFVVYSKDALKVMEMRTAGRKILKKKIFHLSDLHQEALSTSAFGDLLISVGETGMISLIWLRAQSSLLCLGLDPTFTTAVKEVEAFLAENLVWQHVVQMEPSLQDMFCTYLQQNGLHATSALLCVEFDRQNSKLVITGKKAQMEEARGVVDDFLQKIITRSIQLTKPAFGEFLKSVGGKLKLQEVQGKLNCLIGPTGDNDLAEVWGATSRERSRNKIKEKKRRENKEATSHPQAERKSTDVPVTAGREFVNPNTAVVDADAAEETTQVPSKPRIFVKNMSDITKEEHTFFVNSSNRELNLTLGQVSQALVAVGGPKIQTECTKNYPTGIDYGQVAVTGPGLTKKDVEGTTNRRLDCVYILHCTMPEKGDDQQMIQAVRDSVNKCLEMAESLPAEVKEDSTLPEKNAESLPAEVKEDSTLPEKNAEGSTVRGKSIGFPALGAGTLGYPADLVAATMFQTVVDYGNQHPDTSICDVYFILHRKDNKLTRIFIAEHEKYDKRRAGSRQKEEGLNYMALNSHNAEGFKSYKFFEDTARQTKLVIRGLDQQDIDGAVELGTVGGISGHHSRLLQGYPNPQSMGPVLLKASFNSTQGYCHQVQQTIVTCKAARVDVTFNFTLNRLDLRGLRSGFDVNLVHNLIKEAENDTEERSLALLTAMQVEWHWEEVRTLETVAVPYDYISNYRIETAYRNGEKQAIIFDKKRTPFVVDFIKMHERPEFASDDADVDVLTVIRRDKITEVAMDVPPPQIWNPMPGETLDVVPLGPDSTEYKEVENHFKATIKQSSAKIVKVQRIQNLTLYKQYMAMKKQLEIRNPKVKDAEWRPLWHGTKPEGVDSIIKSGFNRSYCERTHYGQAIYFAKEAEYSSAEKYASANASGERNMFLCRVLVGKYTTGNESMRFLPESSDMPGSTYDSAVDDVTDPSIFVVFKDVQAYPEYLIVFKDC